MKKPLKISGTGVIVWQGTPVRNLALSLVLLPLSLGLCSAGDLEDLSQAFTLAQGSSHETASSLEASRAARAADSAPAQGSQDSKDAVAWLRAARYVDPDKASDDEVFQKLSDFGHSVIKHGPDVTDDYLKSRLQKIAVATKFDSKPHMVAAARESWRAAEGAVQSDPGFMQKLEQFMQGRLRNVDLHFFMKDPVGRGFKKTPSGIEDVQGIKEVVAVFEKTQDKVTLLTLYPQGH